MAKRPFTTSHYTWGYSFLCTSLPALLAPIFIALAMLWLATPDPVTAGHGALALEVVR